jgi:hypothetical protein
MPADTRIPLTVALLAAWCLLPALARAGPPAQAVEAWDAYVASTERRIDEQLNSGGGFLAAHRLAPASAALALAPAKASGLLYVAPVSTAGKPGADEVPGGLRHHWLAAVFVPGVKVEDVLAFVQDYDHQAGVFPDVLGSKLVSREGDYFEPWLRLRRTKVITAVYDTTHSVWYRTHGPGRASSRSVATRIVELEKAGDSSAWRERPPGKDRGFLWRLNSYWRFLEADGGVIVECESLSLSRGIPAGLGWLVGRFVNSIPRESLEQTLFGIRAGTLARFKSRATNPAGAGRR